MTTEYYSVHEITSDPMGRRGKPARKGILPMCAATWNNAIRAGKIPEGFRIGRRRYWTREQVEAVRAKMEAGGFADTREMPDSAEVIRRLRGEKTRRGGVPA